MRWVLGSGMRFWRLVVALAIGLVAFGIAQLRSAPVDVYPEFTPPAVQIQTEALGLSAAEVEQLITVPLEQDLLNGVPWLDRIHSSSMPGLSAIDLTFQPGTNLYAARQMVQERMTQAHALPNVGSPPIMIQPLASASRVAMVRVSSATVSPVEMSCWPGGRSGPGSWACPAWRTCPSTASATGNCRSRWIRTGCRLSMSRSPR